MESIVRVGVGVIIRRGEKVLLGKRKNAHGAGDWSFPGGHLEFGEEWFACAQRETLEETGLHVSAARFVALTNDIFEKERKHYITIFLLADGVDGEPRVMEPEKCERWEWFAWDALPSELFLPIRNLRKQEFDLNNY